MVIQDTFDIPDNIATGLATGLYRRIGGVVRYATGPNNGQIVAHLKPIDQKTVEQTKSLGARALHFVQQHKNGVKGTAILVGCAAVIGLIWWGYTKWKNREHKGLVDFRVALNSYVDAIRKGNLDIARIDAVLRALNTLKKNKNYKKICIQLTAEDLEVLISNLYHYTIKLAADNSVQIADSDLNVSGAPMLKLQSYLEAQRKVFHVA